MTSHEKKRLLESDIQALTAEFLEVREKQLNVEELNVWRELEVRAGSLLEVIAKKQHDVANLFPSEEAQPLWHQVWAGDFVGAQ